MRNLNSRLKLSGWQKGLLVAANHAQLCMYGEGSLSQDEVRQLRDSFRAVGERMLYNSALHSELGVRGEISNVQTTYLRLREQLATLRGLFMLLRQQQLFAELLNDALCQKGKVVGTIRNRVLSDRHKIIGGELGLRTETNAPPYFEISVSDDSERDVYECTIAIRDNMRELKREVEVARKLVQYSPANLTPYKEYIDGIEGEVRDLVRSTKCQLYDVDSEEWPSMREAVAKIDDELLKFVEALPDY